MQVLLFEQRYRLVEKPAPGHHFGMVDIDPNARARRRWLVLVVAVVAVGGIAAVAFVRPWLQPDRSTPLYDPPVLAGQQLWGACAGGFYARLGETIVLTSSGHCATEGSLAYDEDGTVRGVFGPIAQSPSCEHAEKKCKPSDMNYLIVAEDQVPWGHLNMLDLGAGGYRTLGSGTAPLACGDIEVGDDVEINGRNIHRTGTVLEKGAYLHDGDGDFFACMVAADVQVATGDSGGAVLVEGIPAGVTSRSFDGLLGFTPLAEGLAHFGLELCTTPNCDLAPP
jgi:hypothetical protein